MVFFEWPARRDGRLTRRVMFMSQGAWKGGFELNLVGYRWGLRLARHQMALWKDHRPMIAWHAGWGIGGFWQPWNRPRYPAQVPDGPPAPRG